MNSRRISRNKKYIRIIAVTVLCLATLMIVPVFIRSVVAMVVAPVNAAKTWLYYSGQSFPQYFRDRSALLEKIRVLESQLAQESGNAYTIKTLVAENQELRKLLGDEGEQRILASVIGRPGMLPYDVLMLDRGSKDGIQVGAPVYIKDNTVIGLVQQVTASTALVRLITSPGFTSTVYIIGPNIYTTAKGIGGGQLRVGVPQGITLSEGDLVVLPSIMSGVYGEIHTVQSIPTEPEQYGFVSPDIPLTGIRFVSVGTTPMQSVSFEEAQQILQDIKTSVFVVPVPEDVLIDTQASTSTATSSREDNMVVP